MTTLARTDEMATVTEPATVELILGAADLRILGGRGGVSNAAWAAVEGRPFAEVLGDGADVDDLAGGHH